MTHQQWITKTSPSLDLPAEWLMLVIMTLVFDSADIHHRRIVTSASFTPIVCPVPFERVMRCCVPVRMAPRDLLLYPMRNNGTAPETEGTLPGVK